MIKYAKIVISYIDFFNYLEKDTSKFIEELNEEKQKLIELSGCFFDNNVSFRFHNIYGEEFCFSIYEYDNQFDVAIWNYTGMISIINVIINKDNIIDSLKKIKFACEKWCVGEKMCNGCGEWMNYQENRNHHYFAAVYCRECWESKYKAIEAKENYD